MRLAILILLIILVLPFKVTYNRDNHEFNLNFHIGLVQIVTLILFIIYAY